MQQTGWSVADLHTIEVQSFPRLVNDMMDYRPKTVTDAQFSLPWTLAAVAAGLPPGADWYTEDNMQNPALLALADKVTATVTPEFTQRMNGPARQPGARVVVTNSRGERAEQERYKPLGSTERPLSDGEIIAKARRNLPGHKIKVNELLTSVMEEETARHYSSSADLMGFSLPA